MTTKSITIMTKITFKKTFEINTIIYVQWFKLMDVKLIMVKILGIDMENNKILIFKEELTWFSIKGWLKALYIW